MIWAGQGDYSAWEIVGWKRREKGKNGGGMGEQEENSHREADGDNLTRSRRKETWEMSGMVWDNAIWSP